MAFFVLASKINVQLADPNSKGRFASDRLSSRKVSFNGVNNINIRKSMLRLKETCEIDIPLTCLRNGNKVKTSTQLLPGSRIDVFLGYGNVDRLPLEFSGFISYAEDKSDICRVTCEGFSYLLSEKTVNKSWSEISLKQLLREIVGGTGIKLECTIDCNITGFRTSGTAFKAIEALRRYLDDTVTFFFISPTVLWVGLVWFPYADQEDVLQVVNNGGQKETTPTVKLLPGYNAIDAELSRRETTNTEFIIYKSRGNDGQFHSTKRSDSHTNSVKILNGISDKSIAAKLAKEKNRARFSDGYEGQIKGFLEPFALPGFKLELLRASTEGRGTKIGKTGSLWAENAGVYVIEETRVIFGAQGGRRIMTLGALIG